MSKIKVLLQGYIGHQNFGDDLLFEIAISKAKKVTNTEISVVITDSNINCDYLYNYYSDLNIIRFDNKIPLLFYKKFDKVYYIGGGIFFDYKLELDNKTFYKKYISNIMRYKIPKLFGTSFGGIGIGIGPYFSIRTQKLHAQIINSFDILGVRDQTSFDLAESMGFQDVILSNDLSLELNQTLQKQDSKSKKQKEVIICPRTYSHKPEYEKHIDELITFADYLEEKGCKTHWVFLQDDDKELINRLVIKYQVTIWNPFQMTILDFINLFRNKLVTYTSRMHSIFISGMVKTPFVAIPLHQKLVFASELFYKEPIIINPLAEQEEYVESFKNLNKDSFSTEKFKDEILNLENLNKKLNTWLRN